MARLYLDHLAQLGEQTEVPCEVLDARLAFAYRQFFAFPGWLNTALRQRERIATSLMEREDLGDGRVLEGVGFDPGIKDGEVTLTGVFAALNPGVGHIPPFIGVGEYVGVTAVDGGGCEHLYVVGPTSPYSDKDRSFGALTCKVKEWRREIVVSHAVAMAEARR